MSKKKKAEPQNTFIASKDITMHSILVVLHFKEQVVSCMLYTKKLYNNYPLALTCNYCSINKIL